jgi:hypothetical protein
MKQRRTQSVMYGIALLTTLALVGAACSSDSDDGGSPSSAAPASVSQAGNGCEEVATLKDSLTALTQVEPVQDGLDALESSAATVKTDLQSAASAVSDELKPAVDEVQTSFDQLESSLQGVTTDNLAASATEIGTALTALGTSLTDLESKLTEKCPAS